MAVLLNDVEIKRLLGTVITDGDPSCIRPNAYVLRLGTSGEFLTTGKEFELGVQKKGLRIQPGHSVGVTALETLDFRRETVHKLFPGQDLHAIVSPTTDLSREGIIAPTTQVDAGFHGTLNWTFSNTSNRERRFVFKERIYRLTIFLLEEGEIPEKLYSGDYQSQTGYVPSKRTGAPVGMKDSEWEDGQQKGGPEDLLEDLIRSGYPWHILGSRLKQIEGQFCSVTTEYAEISSSIQELTSQVAAVKEQQAGNQQTVRNILKDEAGALQNRWMLSSGSMLVALLGISLTIVSNSVFLSFMKEYGVFIGIALVVISMIVLFQVSRKN